MHSNVSLAAKLGQWASTHDLHVKAAVRMLIEQDVFLRREAFVEAAVKTASDGGAYIVFRDARKAFDDGAFDVASSTELALLDLIIAVGENRYRLSYMGPATAQLVIDLFRDALSGPR